MRDRPVSILTPSKQMPDAFLSSKTTPSGMLIVSHLSDEGYLVLEASSGEEAIAILRATNPPAIVVFTDIQLGGWVTGWDVADAFGRLMPKFR